MSSVTKGRFVNETLTSTEVQRNIFEAGRANQTDREISSPKLREMFANLQLRGLKPSLWAVVEFRGWMRFR